MTLYLYPLPFTAGQGIGLFPVWARCYPQFPAESTFVSSNMYQPFFLLKNIQSSSHSNFIFLQLKKILISRHTTRKLTIQLQNEGQLFPVLEQNVTSLVICLKESAAQMICITESSKIKQAWRSARIFIIASNLHRLKCEWHTNISP